MSHVLDFLITASNIEEEDPEDATGHVGIYGHERMKELTAALRELGYDNVPKTAAHRVDQYNGGRKAVQNTVYLGAANWLDPEILRQAILKVNWVEPDYVRVFVCDEHWSAFEPLPLDKVFTRE
jgi:hypothetical protein